MLPRNVVAAAAKQRGLITLEGLEVAGLTRNDRRRALEAGALVSVLRGVYRLGEFAELPETRWLAASLWHPEAVVSHRTAAALHGFLEVEPSAPVDLLAMQRRVRIPEGIRFFSTEALPAEDRKVVRGIPVTSKARTLFDLASVVTDEELAFAVEAALRDREVSLDWLQRRLRQLRASGRDGVARLSRIVADVEARGTILQSALEVRFWRKSRDVALPMPHCQYPFDDDYGQRRWIDFAWPAALLAVETRGAKEHGTPEGFEKNSRRTARLTAMGWSVMPVTWSMLQENPARVMKQVAQALQERGLGTPTQARLL